jgi:hypothetical protein
VCSWLFACLRFLAWCPGGFAGAGDAGFVGEDYDLHAVSESELGEDAGDVAFHGGFAEVELARDARAIGRAFCL